MNRLTREIILRLANKFGWSDGDIQKGIVDQLGFDPFNHVWFYASLPDFATRQRYLKLLENVPTAQDTHLTYADARISVLRSRLEAQGVNVQEILNSI